MSLSLFGLTLTLLLLASLCQAGIVHRNSRDVQPVDVVAVTVILSEPVASELRKDQIPVQVIELQEPEPVQSQSKVETVANVAEPAEPVVKQIAPLAAASNTETEIVPQQVAVIAEDKAQAIEAEQKLRAVAAVVEAERKNDEEIVQEEVKEAVQEANKELLRAVVEVETAAKPSEIVAESVQQPVEQHIEEKSELVIPAENVLTPEVEQQTQHLLLPESAELSAQDPVPSVRQATQPTPTQTSTQTNFMQQLIQPIGQFISQITGQQQPQQQQPTGQVTVSDGSNPGPTLPGFLNPSNAITSAQQAVQNVVNSTSQAFQGLQQFATNIGTTFQNTLSNLGGQQSQLSSSGSTTVRPPGPIQSFVSNIIGGNNQQSASPPAQPQGPLQGILSFFQGGNRPQATVAAVVAPAEQLTSAIASSVDDKIGADQTSPAEAEVTNEVRNSEEVVNEEVVPSSDEVINEASNSVEVVNEVPNSEEVVNDVPADSFEEAQPEELIVVNDDVETPAVVA